MRTHRVKIARWNINVISSIVATVGFLAFLLLFQLVLAWNELVTTINTSSNECQTHLLLVY